MARQKYSNISDIPSEELKSMMIAFGKQKARTVKSSRAFLRSIGFQIDRNGIMSPTVEFTTAHVR